MLMAQLFSQARPAQHVLPVRRSSCSRVVCQGFKRGMQQTSSAPAGTTATAGSPPEGEAQITIAVPIEQAPAAQQQSQSGFSIAWILVAAAVAAGLVFKKLKSNDPSREYMRSIQAMEMESLDPEVIAAARARRSRERANHRLDLDEVELPENHPWATRKPVTAEQEAAIQARLQVRPRRAGGPGDGRSGSRTRQLGRE